MMLKKQLRVHNIFNSSRAKDIKNFIQALSCMYLVGIPLVLACLMNLIDDPFLFSFGMGLWQFLSYKLVHNVNYGELSKSANVRHVNQSTLKKVCS